MIKKIRITKPKRLFDFIKDKTNYRNPVYRRYAEDETKPTIFAFKINTWKRDYIASVYPEYNWIFVGMHEPAKTYHSLITKCKNPIFLVWGYNEFCCTRNYAERHNIPLWRMEDGFIRSIGLGAHHVLPMSLVIDKTGTLYFDPSSPSGIEKMTSCTFVQAELEEAKVALQHLQQSKVNKYNTSSAIEGAKYYDSFGSKGSNKRILVIGQVEDDASIRLGGCGFDNGALVKKARDEHPNAQIFFKVHPDVLAGKREIKTSLEEIEQIAHIIREPMSMISSFESVDQVYTISSLGGFEALLHGLPVTVAGQPFYSGYGMTNDINPCDRRKKSFEGLSKSEILLRMFYITYMMYPDYFNSDSCNKISMPDAIEEISRQKSTNN